MNLGTGFLYAKKIIFSRTIRGAENSAGKRSLLGAVICIAVSVVPLVALVSIGRGMFRGITERMIYLFSRDILVSVYDGSACTNSAELFEKSSAEFLNVNGVKKIFPEIQGTSLAAGANFRTGAFIRGVQGDIFFKDEKFSSLFKFTEGEWDLSQKRNAVIGEKIAEDLDLHAGDQIKIISVEKIKKNYVPRVVQFTVKGIVSSGYQELDALWVFVPLEDAFECISKSSRNFAICLETDDPFSDGLSRIVSDVKIFASENSAFEDSRILSWKQANADRLSNFSSTEALLVIIMVMIVLVSSINISSSVVMIVMERKKEIAILKCVGASSAEISSAFIFTGTFAGLAGLCIGVPVGVIFSAEINSIVIFIEKVVNFFTSGFSKEKFHLLDPAYYLQEIPVQISWNEIFVIIVCTTILSALVSVFPSLKAGNEKISDTLRKM
jgi:lipoprotein-releasing system permease protein